MVKTRKLRHTKARERLVQEMDAWAALDALNGVPEEWTPFFHEEEQPQPMPVEGDGGDEPAAEEEGDDPISFSHFSRKKGDEVHYTRAFSSVRDYCEQPFANPANEALWRKEEFIDGKFREWGDGKKLREHHEEVTDPEAIRRKNISWFGAEHADEAAARAFKGWPEGADRVRSMMDNVNAPPPVSLRRKIQRAEQGDELDVHSVYRGDLDHAWTRRRRLNTRSRMSVRIVAALGGSNMMDGEQMFWRGAAVAKLAEVLEESGYRVEIIGVNQHFVDGHDTTMHCNFIVKDAAAPLDLEQVAGVVCNPGFFRTWGFRDAYAVCEHKIRDTVVEPIYKDKRVNGRWVHEKTGRFTQQTLLARSYVRNNNPVREGNLDADGTKTFSVPSGVGEVDEATRWVNACLAELDGGAAAEQDDE